MFSQFFLFCLKHFLEFMPNNNSVESYLQLEGKILIISISGIGNYLMATPLIHEIKMCNPCIELSVLVQAQCQQLAKHNKDIDQVLIFNVKRLLKIIRHIRLLKFDVEFAVIPSNRIRDALIGWLCRIPIRITHKYKWPRNKDCAFLFTHLVDWDISKHDVESNLDLLHNVFNKNILVKVTPKYILDLSQDYVDFSDKYLKNLSIGVTDILIGIHPGSAEGGLGKLKRWPAENFCLLASMITKNKGIKVVFFLGPGERDIQQKILFIQNSQIFVVSRLSIMSTAAIIHHCSMFIGNDSGLSHLACAMNIPVLTLWGPTDPRRSRPYSDKSNILCLGHCKYSPCYTNLFRGINCVDNNCLKSVTVNEVLAYVVQSGVHIS